jgi:hypothetical protein
MTGPQFRPPLPVYQPALPPNNSTAPLRSAPGHSAEPGQPGVSPFRAIHALGSPGGRRPFVPDALTGSLVTF